MPHKRILVADGNQKFIEKTREILDAVGIETAAAETGRHALTLWQTERPDGALVNAELASMPGTEVCRRLKAHDPSAPVVLMFTEERGSLDETAWAHEADNFLVRPIRRKELLHCVRFMLRLRRVLVADQATAALVGDDAKGPLAMVGLDLFHSFLALEIRRADRYGFPLSVLSIGVDPLPPNIPNAWRLSLEKQLGEALTDAIRRCVRDIDVSAALSLEEVGVLMPHTDAHGARIVAERVRQAVARQPYHFGRNKLQPTVSIGIGVIHGERMPAARLLSAAQSRRMQAMHAGGNRVTS